MKPRQLALQQHPRKRHVCMPSKRPRLPALWQRRRLSNKLRRLVWPRRLPRQRRRKKLRQPELQLSMKQCVLRLR